MGGNKEYVMLFKYYDIHVQDILALVPFPLSFTLYFGTNRRTAVHCTTKCSLSKSQFRVIHETMHTLGFWHESTRPDRDEHIAIQWDDLNTDLANATYKIMDFQEANAVGEYDVCSIMHTKDNYPLNEENGKKKKMI